jgi:hypothetical protein
MGMRKRERERERERERSDGNALTSPQGFIDE